MTTNSRICFSYILIIIIIENYRLRRCSLKGNSTQSDDANVWSNYGIHTSARCILSVDVLKLLNILLVYYCVGVCVLSGSSNTFKADPSGLNGCACQRDILVYECTNCGRSTIIWHESALHCSELNNELVFFQSFLSQYQLCNNGAVTTRGLRVEDGCYSSQLNVSVSNRHELDNATIGCLLDNGTVAITIGNSQIPPIASKLTQPILFAIIRNA